MVNGDLDRSIGSEMSIWVCIGVGSGLEPLFCILILLMKTSQNKLLGISRLIFCKQHRFENSVMPLSSERRK